MSNEPRGATPQPGADAGGSGDSEGAPPDRDDAPEVGEAPPSPEESLALIDATDARARRELGGREAPIWYVWGLAWLLAFGVSYLAAEPPAPLGGLPDLVLALLWPAAIGGGIAFQSIYIARHTRGRGGRTVRQESRVGFAYGAAIVLTAALIPMLDLLPENPGDDPVVLWDAAMLFVFTLAVLFLVIGAYENDRLWTGSGLWLGAVNVLAALAFPDHYGALLAVLGGGGFVVGGVLRDLRFRRDR
ncbi:hypothetical protein ER308_11755 [Egibacter rhizosphaerae]|uniref:Uncharacterized protein n=1 Tax=Egibacter rhizosphaerae TaxID=1670831 RepID=A0A411YGG5_9ACTN|nr:hypothetical protein [Egibacter rhizosphaerae]QBI20172.1 hypothetical protein ER308_11755 [Egibacter rhizosphaerae]